MNVDMQLIYVACSHNYVACLHNLSCMWGTLFNVQANNVVIYSLVFEEALKFHRGRVPKFT